MSATGDLAAQGLWLLLAIILVGSALIGHRMPMMRLVTGVAAWALLFLGATILFRWIEPEIIAWQQDRRGGEISVRSRDGGTASAPPQSGSPVLSPSLTEVEIPLSADGHYWIDATVGGQPVRFLIDSGASVTALSEETARRLGLPPDPMNATMTVQTANGSVSAQRSVIDALEIGPIRATRLPVIVSPAFGGVNVLGMNFLGKLRGWRVRDGRMVLEAG